MPEPAQLRLTIDPGFKTIPYTPAVRDGGSVCHGFKPLKGRPGAEAEAIEEARDADCLKRALVDINKAETSFFTVGCEKSWNTEASGFWVKGYIEFAFNFSDLAADATSYFVAFFHFNRLLEQRSYTAPVSFHWELQGACFLDANRSSGFTAAVWIETGVGPSAELVRQVWCGAVDILRDHLCDFQLKGTAPIYSSDR